MQAPRVFISHASDDEAAAIAAQKQLEAEGTASFLAIVDAGRDLDDPARVLARALAECDRVLVLWSSSAANAAWVIHEWDAFSRRGREACDIVRLDDTDFPAHLEGRIIPTPSAWLKALENAPQRSVTPPRTPRSAGTRLYVTASPSGAETAARAATRARSWGYEVVELWQLSEEDAKARASKVAGDWIIIAADADLEPAHWSSSFNDPDEHPRRLLMMAERANVPAFLSLCRAISIDDRGRLDQWLDPPKLGPLCHLIVWKTGWKVLAARIHDALTPDFSSVDSRLDFIDLRLRGHLLRVRMIAAAIAVLAHVSCAALTFVLPLLAADVTRRHLMLSLSMILFAATCVEVRSVAAGAAVAAQGGSLSALSVVIAGLFIEPGAPGISIGAGAALAAIAATELALIPDSRGLLQRPVVAATRGAWTVGLLLLPLAAGLFILWLTGNLASRPFGVRTFVGALFGALGGATVGGALAWLRSYAHRRRDRRRTLRIVSSMSLVGALLAGAATALDPGDPSKLLNGVGVGIFVGAVIVGLSSAPKAAMKRFVSRRWLPMVACAIAVIVAALVSLVFRGMYLREYIGPCLLVGILLGLLLLELPALIISALSRSAWSR